MAGNISINDVVILDGPLLPAWDTDLFLTTLNLKLGCTTIHKIKIGDELSGFFNCSSSSLCELIDCLLNLSIHDDGLKALEMTAFDPNLITNLEEALITRLTQKCANLDSLTVAAMSRLQEETRK